MYFMRSAKNGDFVNWMKCTCQGELEEITIDIDCLNGTKNTSMNICKNNQIE